MLSLARTSPACFATCLLALSSAAQGVRVLRKPGYSYDLPVYPTQGPVGTGGSPLSSSSSSSFVPSGSSSSSSSSSSLSNAPNASLTSLPPPPFVNSSTMTQPWTDPLTGSLSTFRPSGRPTVLPTGSWSWPPANSTGAPGTGGGGNGDGNNGTWSSTRWPTVGQPSGTAPPSTPSSPTRSTSILSSSSPTGGSGTGTSSRASSTGTGTGSSTAPTAGTSQPASGSLSSLSSSSSATTTSSSTTSSATPSPTCRGAQPEGGGDPAAAAMTPDIDNGGFEEGLATSPWSIDLVDIFNTAYTLASPGANGSCRAFEASMSANPLSDELSANLRLISEMVVVQPRSRWLVSWWLRFAQANDAEVRVFANGAYLAARTGREQAALIAAGEGGDGGGEEEKDDPELAGGWRKVQARFTAPDRVLQLTFNLALHDASQNTIGIDDVVITPL